MIPDGFENYVVKDRMPDPTALLEFLVATLPAAEVAKAQGVNPTLLWDMYGGRFHEWRIQQELAHFAQKPMVDYFLLMDEAWAYKQPSHPDNRAARRARARISK